MEKSISALIVALAVFASALAVVSAGYANDYDDYPDWASETFSDADDKGAP